MKLRLYQPCDLEQWIDKQYEACGIESPSDLSIKRVSDFFRIEVRFTGTETKAIHDQDCRLILLNNSISETEQRAEFFHEVCHIVRHAGVQHRLTPSFVHLQEVQANLFQQYAAMPFFMILQYEEDLHSPNAVPLLAHEFRLPPVLVQRRLEQMIARIRKAQAEQDIVASAPPREPAIISHSPDTLKLLAKLSWLAAQKGRKINWEGK